MHSSERLGDETLGERTRNIILESRKPVLVVTPDE
jgi:hypothetical protein